MIKRMRTLDVPKFRRPLKNRTRLGESVYFSPHNLIYLKFVMMWLGCIALDFIIGFRFELLWPVWLLMRHLYESFRVHAFSSSLHYSAFSVFFVCVTATSDLVCYLFIPIQVLLFLASTYVWMQFVYQSTERGICVPSLVLWTIFLMFEYSMRYRFENATWYLTRSSWITAGLFPSTADNVPIGSASNSTSPPLSPRFELYRPFAAHCIGFPVVTLGFRVKSFFSKWRMRVRREEVMRQNEFFERLLVEAVPSTFENRHHFISSSRRYLTMEQDLLEHEFGSTFPESGADTNGGGRFYSQISSSYASSGGVPLAICGGNQAAAAQSFSAALASNAGIASSAQSSPSTAAAASRKCSQKAFTRSFVGQRQNGQLLASNGQSSTSNLMSSVNHRRNGTVLSSSSASYSRNNYLLENSTNNLQKRGLQSVKQQQTSVVSYSSNGFLYKLWRILIVARLLQLLSAIAFSTISTIYERIICPIGGLLGNTLYNIRDKRSLRTCPLDSGGGANLAGMSSISEKNNLSCLMELNYCAAAQDDLISSSGDGSSHVGAVEDYYESDQEERLSQYTASSATHTSQSHQLNTGLSNSTGLSQNVNIGVNSSSSTASSKKKSRKARGRTPAVLSEVVESLNVNNDQCVNNGFKSGNEMANGTTKSTSPMNLASFTNCNGHQIENPNTAHMNDAVGDKFSLCNGSEHGNDAGAANAKETHLNSMKNIELRQLSKEKELLESCIEKLNSDLKNTRSDVLELRTQLSQAQQNERITKAELVQCRTKVEQLEARGKQLSKQNEHIKSVAAGYEKRIGEVQLKKLELERELANERHSAALLSASSASVSKARDDAPHSKQNSGGHFKKISELERELKALRRELRAKDEASLKIEDEIRQLRFTNVNMQSDEKSFSDKIDNLRQKNYLLEQTLSSENRLKQDLFRALNDSKAQIETLTVRLRCYEQSVHESSANSSNIFDSVNGLVDFSGDEFLGLGNLVDHRQQHNILSNNSISCQQSRQNSSPLSSLGGCGSGSNAYVASPKSATPPPLAIANLDQLMQATGAQHMSYSFAPFESNSHNESLKTMFESTANCGDVRSNNLQNSQNAVGSSRKISSSNTIGGHRNAPTHNGSAGAICNNVNGNAPTNSSNNNKTSSLTASPTAQQQQQQKQQATAKAN